MSLFWSEESIKLTSAFVHEVAIPCSYYVFPIAILLYILVPIVLSYLGIFASGVWDWFTIPSIKVELVSVKANSTKHDPKKPIDKDVIVCYDPATMLLLGHMPAMSKHEVERVVANAKEAANEWKFSSFRQRRLLLKILLKFIIENQDEICRVSARDSGKTLLDAVLGEIVVTCEKIHWLCKEGEKYLRPDKRSAGILSFYKTGRVEFHPLGVIGAIVPWNYPFHNVLNPLTAAVFAGNSIVIKVSEHASWSTQYYSRMINAALEAAGAPPKLVQFVVGYGEAGEALVQGGVDKVIFVGSTTVGRHVMKAAAATLTPVVLELGGKDAFVVCEDADLNQVIQVALKAAFLNCNQNCMGGERFFVHRSIYNKYIDAVVAAVKKMRQGPPLGSEVVDVGALCMPGHADKVHALVTQAVSAGARLAAGGVIPEGEGQFYPPTVLCDVKPGMKIWEEEVFGPVMCVIPWENDEEVIALANDCPFGLGSSVFAASQSRARRIGAALHVGMVSINDFASTYMCQSLPFGGVKHSGFDRFGGIEGLRGLCVPKSVAEDAWPWLMKSNIPAPWQHPVSSVAAPFGYSLITMFYGIGPVHQIRGLIGLLQCLMFPGSVKKSKRE